MVVLPDPRFPKKTYVVGEGEKLRRSEGTNKEMSSRGPGGRLLQPIILLSYFTVFTVFTLMFIY